MWNKIIVPLQHWQVIHFKGKMGFDIRSLSDALLQWDDNVMRENLKLTSLYKECKHNSLGIQH